MHHTRSMRQNIFSEIASEKRAFHLAQRLSAKAPLLQILRCEFECIPHPQPDMSLVKIMSKKKHCHIVAVVLKQMATRNHFAGLIH